MQRSSFHNALSSSELDIPPAPLPGPAPHSASKHLSKWVSWAGEQVLIEKKDGSPGKGKAVMCLKFIRPSGQKQGDAAIELKKKRAYGSMRLARRDSASSSNDQNATKPQSSSSLFSMYSRGNSDVEKDHLDNIDLHG